MHVAHANGEEEEQIIYTSYCVVSYFVLPAYDRSEIILGVMIFSFNERNSKDSLPIKKHRDAQTEQATRGGGGLVGFDNNALLNPQLFTLTSWEVFHLKWGSLVIFTTTHLLD